MAAAVVIIGVLIAVVFLALALNPAFRKQLHIRFKGTTEEVMTKDAMTPEGAAAYYNNAITEKNSQVVAANNLYIELTGKLNAAQRQLYELKKDEIRYNRDLEAAVDANKEQESMTLSMKLNTIDSKKQSLENTIKELEKSTAQQKERKDNLEQELIALKEEKEQTVFDLQANTQIIEANSKMSAAVTNESDNMLEKVREGAKKTREKAIGSQIAYETSMSTQERRAEQAAKEEQARQRIEALKRKQGK